MSITFYPSLEDSASSRTLNFSLADRVGLITEAAERFKAAVMDMPARPVLADDRELAPKDLPAAFNWGEISKLLKEVRELPEADDNNKRYKAEMLSKLAETYEILRAARMSKLEAVRLALVTEANQLKGGGAAPQVA